jgi:hypothetical protein
VRRRVDHLRAGELAGGIGLDRVAVHLADRRCHHEQRQEQGEADQHLVRRRLLQAQRLTQHREHDDDPGKAGHHQQDARQDRQQAHDDEDLERQRQRRRLRAARCRTRLSWPSARSTASPTPGAGAAAGAAGAAWAKAGTAISSASAIARIAQIHLCALRPPALASRRREVLNSAGPWPSRVTVGLTGPPCRSG